MKSKHFFLIATASCTLLGAAQPLLGQGTAFSYQGRLNSGTNVANGIYDFTFGLFTVSTGSGQVGSTATNSGVAVSNGLFTVTLDFGSQFPGAGRWLQVGVRTNGTGPYDALSPRQKILAVPYSMTASNLTGTLPATQLSGTLPTSTLPANVVTNNARGVTLNGTFIGNGAGLTNLGGLSGPPSGVVPILGMLWVPAGTYVMGSPIDEVGRGPDEGPQTVVAITRGFWMGHHPVTQGEYLARTLANPSTFVNDLNRPVEVVTWLDAANYCALLTTSEQSAGRIPAGWVYRLPTEAEWEYACRAWTTTRFSYGDDPGYGGLGQHAWYNQNSSNTTHGVSQKLPNQFGLEDMSGNVWEWCQDWYGAYPGGAVSNPQGPPTGTLRVMRGGSWSAQAASCRSAQRFMYDPTTKAYNIGFRVVLASP